jgi:hypothetical protein
MKTGQSLCHAEKQPTVLWGQRLSYLWAWGTWEQHYVVKIIKIILLKIVKTNCQQF